jgi:uncharacterized protein YdeI (YjbR/CyaY-like superfamily)
MIKSGEEERLQHYYCEYDMGEPMKSLEIKDRRAWRTWLTENHDREDEIWLVYYKKATGIPSISYQDSLDEALCLGWIDSLIKKIDDQKYARKFTPRKDESKWSLVNKKRVEQLIREGSMTEYGLKKVEAAKRSGSWDAPGQKPKLEYKMLAEFSEALENNPQAKETFTDLAPSYQKQYLAWISTAKRSETRQKRITESINLLNKGNKLGLK